MSTNVLGVECAEPEGAFYVFPDVRGLFGAHPYSLGISGGYGSSLSREMFGSADHARDSVHGAVDTVITNALVIDRLNRGEKPRVPVRDDTLRTLIWTPDASRALAALGNAPDAYGQTWHLPCDNERLTYKQFVALAADVFGRTPEYSVISSLAMKVAGLFKKEIREISELLPRYKQDNLFDSSKFKQRFADFAVTTYREGLRQIQKQAKATVSSDSSRS